MTVDAKALLKLAERCEAATGPDRELDFLIADALDEVPDHQVTDQPGTPYGWFRRDGQWSLWRTKESDPNAGVELWQPKPLTTSLDAAMTLVPEGFYGWSVHRYSSGTRARSGVYLDDGKDKGHYVNAATPALALCAAALRARASQ